MKRKELVAKIKGCILEYLILGQAQQTNRTRSRVHETEIRVSENSRFLSQIFGLE